MKKLRLIKPWNLRAVRQGVTDERFVSIEYSELNCFGAPRGEVAFNTPDSEWTERANIGCHDGRSENRNRAPFSDVIFAFSNNIRN